MANVTKLEHSTVPQNYSTLCASIGWELTPDDTLFWFKSAFAGITDALNILKNKTNPVAILIQDLKGNKVVYACVQYIPSEDASEASAGNWTYFWSWDCDDIAEDTVIYTIDQEQIQKIISNRAYDLYKISMTSLSFVSQLTVYMFNVLYDALDQQAVEEGGSWTIELDGFFEASVEVVEGKKEFSLLPKGEMKTLIKDDAGSEK